jgi:hypothetical protein
VIDETGGWVGVGLLGWCIWDYNDINKTMIKKRESQNNASKG